MRPGLGVVAAMLVAGTVSAAALSEADMPGAAFGPAWNNLTAIGAGVTSITGTGASNSFDNFVFEDLPAGSQEIRFRFAAPEGIGYSYSAGGSILYSATPFDHAWDGTTLGTVHVGHAQQSGSLVLPLGDDFEGTLYLALNFTYGADLAYSIDVPSNAAAPAIPAPIPISAGIVFMGAAFGALGIARLRRSGGTTA